MRNIGIFFAILFIGLFIINSFLNKQLSKTDKELENDINGITSFFNKLEEKVRKK